MRAPHLGRGWSASGIADGSGALPRPREPTVTVFTIEGAVDRGGIPALCARLRALLESGAAETVVCDVGKLARVDLAAVDALARLRLVARRSGSRFWVRHASAELQALLAFLGLSDAVPLEPTSALEPQW